MMAYTFARLAAIAGLTALSGFGAASFAQEPMDCAVVSFGDDGNVAVAGGARLERGVAASPGMRGTLSLPREGAQPVTGAWEAGAAVLFIGAERAVFSGREYAGRPGTDNLTLAGRLEGRPVFFSCNPASGSAPAPAPEPLPDPEPEPAEDRGWRNLTVPFSATVDLDTGQIERADGSSPSPDADIAFFALRGAAMFLLEPVLIGPPADGAGSLADRCLASRREGLTRELAVPLDPGSLGAVICFQTNRGALGALILDGFDEAQVDLRYQIFPLGPRG